MEDAPRAGAQGNGLGAWLMEQPIGIGAPFMRATLIALVVFEERASGMAIAAERHDRLVPPEEMTADDLAAYRTRSP